MWDSKRDTDVSDQIRSHQSLSRVRLFATPWIAACQASLSITNSQSLPRLTFIESVMPSSHLILCRPFFSCPQSLPASESVPVSQLFTWGGQSTGVSALASFLPKNTQGWSPIKKTTTTTKKKQKNCTLFFCFEDKLTSFLSHKIFFVYLVNFL